MAKTNQIGLHARFTLSVLIIVGLTACGANGTGSAENYPPDAVLLDSGEQTLASGVIAADPGTPEFTPSLGNGLPISYQDSVQDFSPDAGFIAAQWEYMQSCLQVSAQEPQVVVVTGVLEPTASNDDVVRHIDGQIQASSHVTNTSTTIQVHAQDLDGSLGSPGAYLRSIIGRYLWLANSLAERDYPYRCARG